MLHEPDILAASKCCRLWCFDSGEEEQEDDETGFFSVEDPAPQQQYPQAPVDSVQDESPVGPSPREQELLVDASFRLPTNYDALLEYESRFGEFDISSGDTRLVRTSSVTVTSDGVFDQMCLRMSDTDTTSSHKGTPRSVFSDFNLCLIMIRQSADPEQRRRLIAQYEAWRDQYRDHRVCEADGPIASNALEQARHANTLKEKKLECYRRAIFFTHHRELKEEVKREYVQYCATLKA
jgi:hypothetical protein